MNEMVKLVRHVDDNDIHLIETTETASASQVHIDTVQALYHELGNKPFCRKQFSPIIIPAAALPNASLLDVERSGTKPEYRYRVFGTAMRETIGADLNHKTVQDYPRKTCRIYLSHLFDECERRVKPLYSKSIIEYPTGINLKTEKTLIPIIDEVEDDKVSMILTLFTFSHNDIESRLQKNITLEPLIAQETYRVFENLGQMINAWAPEPMLNAVG